MNQLKSDLLQIRKSKGGHSGVRTPLKLGSATVAVAGLTLSTAYGQLGGSATVSGQLNTSAFTGGPYSNSASSNGTPSASAYSGLIANGSTPVATGKNTSLITSVDPPNQLPFTPYEYGEASVGSDGTLHAGAVADALGSVNVFAYATNTATATVSGVATLTGPTSSGGQQILSPMNFALDGLIGMFPGGESAANISVTIEVSENQTILFDDTLSSFSGYSNQLDDANGGFSNVNSTISGDITFLYDGVQLQIPDLYTNPISLSAGQVDVTMTLKASATGGATFLDYGAGVADFLNTFSFSQNTGVLDLPSGWDLNSSDFHIVNNHFAAVPEPLSALPLTLGLGLLAVRRLRKL